MNPLAPYLTRSSHNIFYFRRIVPTDLRSTIHKSEIKKSLKTYDPKVALRIGQLYCLYIDSLF